MYTKDLGERMTLRLNEEQREYLIEISNMTGIKPSEYLRMLLNTTMFTYRKQQKKLEEAKPTSEEITGLLKEFGGTSSENVKTDKHNLL